MSEHRARSLREMDAAEQHKLLGELRRNLMKIKGGLASGGIPEDVGKTREIRRTIARILTIQSEPARKDAAGEKPKSKEEKPKSKEKTKDKKEEKPKSSEEKSKEKTKDEKEENKSKEVSETKK